MCPFARRLIFLVLAHWIASLFWIIEPDAFRHLRTPIGNTSPPMQQYFTALYWSLSTLLRVPWVAPETTLGRLFTSIATFTGALLFAFFNAEVHAIVRGSLGATLARTQSIVNLRDLFGRTTTGMLTQTTAIQWTTAAATEQRLPGDNAREQNLIKTLPSNLRVELLSGMFVELRRSECGLEGRVSPYAMSTIAAQCWPAVFLARQVLVNANSYSADVFILQHGSLRLSGGVSKGATTQPMARGASNRGKSIKSRSVCAANSSRGGREGTSLAAGSSKHTTKAASNFSLPVQLPGAECSRFRILERPGSLVGSCEMAPAPFIIESIKLSHVLVLNAPAALKLMPAADAQAVRLAVKRQQAISIDYLTGKKRMTNEEMDQRVAEEMASGASGVRMSTVGPRPRLHGGRGSIGSMTYAQAKTMQHKASAHDAVMTRQDAALRSVMDGDEAVSLEKRATMLRESLRDINTLMVKPADQLREAIESRRRQLGLSSRSGDGDAGLGATEPIMEGLVSSSQHDDSLVATPRVALPAAAPVATQSYSEPAPATDSVVPFDGDSSFAKAPAP